MSKDLSFQLLEMPPEKIWNILTCLNPSKAAFIDNLSGQFLKDNTHDQYLNFAIFLLNSTTFQEVAKLLKLKPLFKKRSKIDTQSDRPISLLPLLSKFIERNVHGQTKELFQEENSLQVSICFPKKLLNKHLSWASDWKICWGIREGPFHWNDINWLLKSIWYHWPPNFTKKNELFRLF